MDWIKGRYDSSKCLGEDGGQQPERQGRGNSGVDLIKFWKFLPNSKRSSAEADSEASPNKIPKSGPPPYAAPHRRDDASSTPSRALEDEKKVENCSPRKRRFLNVQYGRSTLALVDKINQYITDENLNLEGLRETCWKGIPDEIRPLAWKILIGYLPRNGKRRIPTLQKKRNEYSKLVQQYFDTTVDERTDSESATLHQIKLDVPRTCPKLKLFQLKSIQELLTRILYIWAIRHPATGYVQGINDLVTPFVFLFLDEQLRYSYDADSTLLPSKQQVKTDMEIKAQIEKLSTQTLKDVEADSFWCVSHLLEGLQDHYIFEQPGLQKMVMNLEELIRRIDEDLHAHFQKTGIQFFQFAFRWMNCLLLREIPLYLILRMWDTYLCQGLNDGFNIFHVYVCAAILSKFSKELQTKDEFQDIIIYLQDLPTSNWGASEIEIMLAQAWVYLNQFKKGLIVSQT